MKTTIQRNKRGGFTLIEMVGVLAVIAILAALLVPKIFAAIKESTYANTVESYNTVKTAAMQYFGKYGQFAGVNGATITAAQTTNWDNVLLAEGLLEKPLSVKVGSGSTVACVNSGAAVTGFDLVGDGTGWVQSTNGTTSVYCVISNVGAADAWELSQRIDGPSLTPTANTNKTDIQGRVKYALATDQNVYIYIGNR